MVMIELLGGVLMSRSNILEVFVIAIISLTLLFVSTMYWHSKYIELQRSCTAVEKVKK